MSNERAGDVDGDEAPEVLALRAEVARVRDTVIPEMRQKQERISAQLGGRRRRRRVSSSAFAGAATLSAASPRVK